MEKFQNNRWRSLLVFLLISMLFHLLILLIPVDRLTRLSVADKKKAQEKEPVRITLLELPETEERPEQPSRLGVTTHKARKESRRPTVPKEGSGVKARPQIIEKREKLPEKAPVKKEIKSDVVEEKKPAEEKKQKRQTKMALIPSFDPGRGRDEITEKNILDDTLKEEETVDLNTTEFKYISYFSKLKSMIEMVWVYPYSAIIRGEEGTVTLRFTIESSGKLEGVEVLKSSGFPELDAAAVNAVKEAAPFPPLPKSWKIKRLNVVGDFHYILGYRFLR